MLRFNESMMCFNFRSLFIAVSIFIAGQTISAQAVNPTITLFQLPNGGGAGQDIPAGTYRVSGKQLATGVKDAVFSVRVGNGVRVRFCDDDGQATKPNGVCEEFGAGTHDLKSVNFTFIKVWVETTVAAAPPVLVFEGANWSGRTQAFTTGMYRADRNEFGKVSNDHAMSAIVSKGYRIRFCVDEGKWGRGAGDCEEYEDGRYNLRFADSISFIQVIDLSDKSPADDTLPVILFEDSGQAGKMQGFDTGTYLASQKQFGKIPNDTASSISVKKGFRAMVCSDESPEQKCEEFGEGKHDLKLKKAASYLKVWKNDM